MFKKILKDIFAIGYAHCVTGPEVLTGTGTQARTRNMMVPGPRPGPEI